jgi:porin
MRQFKFLVKLLLLYGVSSLANANSSSPYISSNPAAVDVSVGTGSVQRYIERQLGIRNNHGIDLGGAWIVDTNRLLSGGKPHPDLWTSNSSLLLGMTADTEKLLGLQGGLFGMQFLQFNGQPTNEQAGSVQGYNSLPGPKPLQRSELYQLWYRQALLDDRLLIRVGKSVPTFEFNNVVKPVSLTNHKLDIPAVSGLIYTPLFVNTSMIGVLPGYYNSAYGITLSFLPTKQWYASYGVYDGNLAQGVQTGTKVGPTFDGAYFHIAETGFAWLIGKNKMPGTFGVGAWYQAGLIQGPPSVYETHAAGYYLFGSQRIWYRNPGVDTSGVSLFYQYGANNSDALPMTQFVGGGLTAFGLIPHRNDDSMGLGAALSWLNQKTFSRRTELMLQAFYQAKVVNSLYLEPALSCIPTPGASPDLSAAWAGTLRAIVLF